MAKVAVIGSGLGGLAAALTLARAGETVSLFERQVQLGGYAIYFRRQGFTFDTALHVIPAGGPDQAFGKLITGLGLSDKVQSLRLRTGPRIYAAVLVGRPGFLDWVDSFKA